MDDSLSGEYCFFFSFVFNTPGTQLVVGLYPEKPQFAASDLFVDQSNAKRM